MNTLNNKNLIFCGIFLPIVFALILTVSLPQKVAAYYIVTDHVRYVDDFEIDYDSDYNRNHNNPNNYDGNDYYNNDYNNYNNVIPAIYSISPNNVQKNSNTTITVMGNGFNRNSIVKLNNANLNTTFVNSNTLKAQLNSYNDINTTGTRSISVFNSPPGGGFSNAVILTINNATVSSTTTKTSSTASNSTKNKTSSTIIDENSVDAQPVEKENQVKELAANAIFGKNAFMPSSLIQWIFFFILILLGVIIWRKLYVSNEERNVPLKHA